MALSEQILIGSVLISILLFGTMAQGGRASCDMWNRVMWMTFLGGLALAWAMAGINVWAGLCVAVIVTGLLTTVPWEQGFWRAGQPALAAAAAWLALAPAMTPVFVTPILWTFVACGCWAGCWTIYSGWRGQTPYQRLWGRFAGWLPRPVFCWHEDSPTHLKAGQGNSNHLQSVAVLCTGAVVGLASLGAPWVLLSLPLMLQPLIQRVNKEGVLSQAHVHLASLTVAALLLMAQDGRFVTLGLAGYGAGLVFLARPWQPRLGWRDGNRFALWNLALKEIWWPAGWKTRLVGIGTATWEPATAPKTIPRLQGVIFTTAHNEYLQWLVEHGLIGTVILSGYLLNVLWRLWHGGLDGRALFPMAIALCSIAAANFPWSYFHEIQTPPTCTICGKPALSPEIVPPLTHCGCPEPKRLVPSQPLYVGSPTLLAMSLVFAILVEAFP